MKKLRKRAQKIQVHETSRGLFFCYSSDLEQTAWKFSCEKMTLINFVGNVFRFSLKEGSFNPIRRPNYENAWKKTLQGLFILKLAMKKMSNFFRVQRTRFFSSFAWPKRLRNSPSHKTIFSSLIYLKRGNFRERFARKKKKKSQKKIGAEKRLRDGSSTFKFVLNTSSSWRNSPKTVSLSLGKVSPNSNEIPSLARMNLLHRPGSFGALRNDVFYCDFRVVAKKRP